MKMTNKRTMMVLAVLLAGMFLLSGCLDAVLPKRKVSTGGTLPPQPSTGQYPPARQGASEQDLLRAAEQAQREGNQQDALARYEAYLKEFPNSDQADYALAAMGQIRESLGQKDQAIDAYQRLLVEHPDSRYTSEIGYRLAPLYLGKGQYDEAARLIGDMLGKTSQPNDQARLRIMLARAQLGQGNPSQALDLFLKAMNQSTDNMDKDEARKGVRAAVASMPVEDLAQAQTDYPREYPGDIIAYVLVYRLYEQGDKEKARDHLDYFMETFPESELTADAKLLSQAMDGQGKPAPLDFAKGYDLGKPASAPSPLAFIHPAGPEGPVPDYNAMDVACLLPLSGTPLEKYGKLVLKGMQIAFNTYRAQTPGFKANLVQLDTKGDPGKAVQLTEQAAANDKLLAVIGPLLSEEAAPVAPRAEELALPLITLTQKEGIPQVGPHIYRIFLTPEAQAEAVALYSVQVLGLSRFAILHPNDNYGRLMRDYFKGDLNKLGAKLVSETGYDPKTTEFSEAIQQLAGVGKAQKRVGAGRKANVDFEAVFLPDTYKAVAMIAPQFAYHDIVTIRLLGTSLWHTPNLLSTTAHYTQSCIIPTPFYAESERPEVQQFIQAYRADVGDGAAVPGQFEAYGYDAAMLMLTMMDQYHVSSRDALLAALNQMAQFPGVTSRFRFSPDGEYQSDPTLLTVEGNEFKLIQ